MKFFRRTLQIALAVLTLATFAAGKARGASQSEMRDYDAVTKDFALLEWDRAEGAAAKFILKYTNSEHFTEVVLIEAQAQYKQKKCIDMVDLLKTQQMRAGALGDRFAYWLAEGVQL